MTQLSHLTAIDGDDSTTNNNRRTPRTIRIPRRRRRRRRRRHHHRHHHHRQVNAITSYVDGSQIYGPNAEINRQLRDLNGNLIFCCTFQNNVFFTQTFLW